MSMLDEPAACSAGLIMTCNQFYR